MTESYSLEELISGYFDNEFANIEEVAPRFSIKHKIAMRKIFRKFADNAYNESSTNQTVYVPSKPISIRKRLIIVAIIIIGMAVLTGFVIMFFADGFKGKVYHDNTHLFAINTEGCPTTIEKEYELSVLPEGYILYNSSSDKEHVYKEYIDQNGNFLYFIQYVKKEFYPHINTEDVVLNNAFVNNCSALYSEHDTNGSIDSIVIWDNKYYILEISGKFNKTQLTNLAEMNENAGF
ncbi:MAG: DUF4367 domain-containing protein [Alphaproteobacteria bacterium]|nr:DUF4367 domain-containing protein [Alphaproteobacteria bacterium]